MSKYVPVGLCCSNALQKTAMCTPTTCVSNKCLAAAVARTDYCQTEVGLLKYVFNVRGFQPQAPSSVSRGKFNLSLKLRRVANCLSDRGHKNSWAARRATGQSLPVAPSAWM